ncbi:MAG: DMT family transporter [Hoeflea sp.]|nr:DMT family transporter [Hoeflea sp.]
MNTGIVAALFTGVQVGGAIYASSLAVGDTGVAALGFLRYGCAALMLLPFFVMAPVKLPQRADMLSIALLGLGQIVVMICLMNLALLLTSGARVALVFASLPVVTLIANRIVGGRAHHRLEILGGIVTIAAVAWLVAADILASRASLNDFAGMALTLGAAVSIAFCSVLYRPHVARYGSIAVSIWAFAVSLPVLAVLWLMVPPTHPVSSWPISTWALVAGVGVSSGLGYLAWFHAIERLNPASVTGFLSLSPVTAAVLTLIFSTGEADLWALGGAVVLVVIGTVIISFGNRAMLAPPG